MKKEPFLWLAEIETLHTSKAVTQRANPRLLVVDDDRDLCHLVKQYLEPEGFTLSVVHTGGEGIRTAIEGNHELIVLDIMLRTKRVLTFYEKSECASALLS
jgi:CheY-like chemotaxis protein